MEKAAPILGEHTREVLTELLDYTGEEVDQLIAEEVLI
jgi:benzylsuccinate CoA-transferase BbsF subunit/naphthyl-2-methylsuccinate CoA transferase subunit